MPPQEKVTHDWDALRTDERKTQERQLHSADGTMADAMPTRHPPPPEGELNELQRGLLLLKSLGWSNKKIGESAGNVTPQAVLKWLAGGMPKRGSQAPLEAAIRRERAALILRERTKPSALAEDVTLMTQPSVTSVSENAGVVSGGADMGKLIQLRVAEIPGVRYVALELCIMYHEHEIKAGLVGQGVILEARAGAFEGRGCQEWDGPQWWDALRAAHSRMLRAFGQATGPRGPAKHLKKHPKRTK